jgi:hypothetical protein
VFAEGLAAYYARDWSRAETKFRESARLEPLAPGVAVGIHTNPSVKYLDIVAEMKTAKLTDAWDGVYAMSEK